MKHSTPPDSAARHGTAQHSTAQHSTAQHSTIHIWSTEYAVPALAGFKHCKMDHCMTDAELPFHWL